ncbi:roundabout homolog 2-like [Diadema setosum]|uniref:roundabout homolog 2-like n=1 Tax=Diadema setosum TaxID=31175 RepID=UPI003B3B24C6
MARRLATLLLCCCLLHGTCAEGGMKVDKVREAAVGADARRNEEMAPRITEHPAAQSVSKNSPATLSCRASGYPIPEIKWYKDGQLLTSDSHLALTGTGELFFLRVIPRLDIGVYHCVATNSLGSAYSNNATLEIAYLRSDFRREPSDTTALTGEGVVLECSPPRGHPTPEVSWERNGETVVADGTRVRILPDGNLVISQPRPSDQGNYVCAATNTEGTKRSSPGRLVVHSRPTFTAVPEEVLTIPGETITLVCAAEGEPQPSIRWIKKDGSMPEGRYTKLKDSSLRIRNAETSDTGTYVCIAQNDWGDRNVEVHVTVSAAPMFTRLPVDRTVVVGQDAFFLCQATGQPAPSIYWRERKGSRPLMFPGEHVGRFEITNEGRLHITSVTREDEGYYTCSAMSPRGSIEDSAYLRVLDDSLKLPPIIHVAPSNQTLIEGSAAELHCQAEGSTQPSVNWLKDGQELQLVGSRITKDGAGTLKFSSLSPDDAGIYTCDAANSVGSTKWAASLQVIRKSFADSAPIQTAPSITQLPQAPGFPIVDNITRNTMRLSWPSARPLTDRAVSLTGYRLEYFTPDQMTGWTVAAERIQGNSFTVKNLQEGFTYVFMVRGINEHGFGPPSPVSIRANTESGTHREIPGQETAHQAPTTQPDGGDSRDILQDKLDNCGIFIKKGEAIGTKEIKVVWQIVRHGDYIDGYYLRLTPLGSTESNFKIQRVIDAKNAIQGGLQPWTRYAVTVQPFHGLNHVGRESQRVIVRTGQDAPQAAPQFIKASQNGSTAITVSWRPPVADKVPGIIAGYHVFCLRETPPGLRNITTRNNRTLTLAVTDLQPGWQYGIKVAAYTIAGAGPFSDVVYVTLPPGPDDPDTRKGLNDGTTGGGMNTILYQPWFYAAVALALLLVVAFIFVLVWRRHRKKPCSPVSTAKGIISKDNVNAQNMAPRPTQLNGTAHPEGDAQTWTSAGPHSHHHHGCMGNCCTGNGSSGDDTLEKNKPLPAKWPNGNPPVWLQEIYDPKYPSHLQSQVSKETHLTHDSQSSSGFGSSFPTLSTFHGMMMHPSSPEYAVVENEAEMEEELSIHAASTLPIIPSPGTKDSHRPPPQYTQHTHYPHHTDDPEPYASATLVMPPNIREYPARRQNCSDSSSEWSGSWQSANREGRRPGRMVMTAGHGSPRGRHGSHDGAPPIPDRDPGFSDHSSQYSRCSSGSKRSRHPNPTTPGRQAQRNWAEILPPPPEQPPTDIDSPGGSLPPSQPGSLKSSFLRRGSSPSQHMGGQAYVQINPGTCADCEASRCPPVPPRHHQQSPLLNQPLSGHSSPVPIYPPPLLPQQPCRTEIPGPQSHFQPITALSPHAGDSPVHKRGMHKLTRTPPPTTSSGNMTPIELGTRQNMIPLQSGPGSPGRGVLMQRCGSEEQSIASQRVFEDPRHAQIGQELLQYMSRNELEDMSEDAPYAPMCLKPSDCSQPGGPHSLCDVESTELNNLEKDGDLETASNCTGSMLAYGSSSNGSRRNSQASSSSGESFFNDNDFASAVAAAAQSAGVCVIQRGGVPSSSQHLLREDTV